MFEKVNPAHPDKIADRIAGAIVDLAYKKNDNPKVACEVLIGHNTCTIINETDTHIEEIEIKKIIKRILYNQYLKKQIKCELKYIEVQQDDNLANNQIHEIRCGDNGIFKGCPTTKEQQKLTDIVKVIYYIIWTDGKYIINGNKITICQSWMKEHKYYNKSLYYDRVIRYETESLDKYYIIQFLNVIGYETITNPIGDWRGGINVDTGVTNRKLGSDMGDAVTGGGLHGKDLSKADVSVNIYCHLLAQRENKIIEAQCNIGDDKVWVTGYGNRVAIVSHYVPYSEIVAEARKYIQSIGGFEKLAEWGLIR